MEPIGLVGEHSIVVEDVSWDMLEIMEKQM